MTDAARLILPGRRRCCATREEVPAWDADARVPAGRDTGGSRRELGLPRPEMRGARRLSRRDGGQGSSVRAETGLHGGLDAHLELAARARGGIAAYAAAAPSRGGRMLRDTGPGGDPRGGREACSPSGEPVEGRRPATTSRRPRLEIAPDVEQRSPSHHGAPGGRLPPSRRRTAGVDLLSGVARDGRDLPRRSGRQPELRRGRRRAGAAGRGGGTTSHQLRTLYRLAEMEPSSQHAHPEGEGYYPEPDERGIRAVGGAEPRSGGVHLYDPVIRREGDRRWPPLRGEYAAGWSRPTGSPPPPEETDTPR